MSMTRIILNKRQLSTIVPAPPDVCPQNKRLNKKLFWLFNVFLNK